jgi:NitT/TauT family transport system ATP-binding protein
MEDVAVDLPDERDQLGTRSSPRFAELRGHVYELIQQARHHHTRKPAVNSPAVATPPAAEPH